MIESITGHDSLVVNKGEEPGGPSRPPSSQETGTTAASQSAVEVDLRSEIAKDINKNEERTSAVKRPDQSLEEELQKTVEALNDKLNKLDREILFKVDKRINRNYISVIDKQSKEVIREFPPKDIRTFIARFDEFNTKLDSSSDVKSLIINLEV